MSTLADGRKVLVAGATGLVGGQILQALLADPAVLEVHAPSRRPLKISHPKLQVHIVDLGRLPALPPADEAYLALGTRIYRRVGELLGILLVDGPGADGELKSFVSTIEQERRIGNESVVRHIETTFGLPANVTTQRADDVLWAATSFELVDRLVRRCGWSPVEFEAWVADLVLMSIWGRAAISTSDQ